MILFLTLTVLQDVGSESSLVAHIGGILAVFLLDHPLQCVVQLRSYPQRLPERRTEGGKKEESVREQKEPTSAGEEESKGNKS